MPPGIYFLRHGETNSVQATHATEGQRARAQIIAHVRNKDYGAARKVASSASSAGHLGDADISDAIDEALPDPQSAQGLPPHELLAAASAASPAKRAQLMPVVRNRFADLSSVSPDGQHQLRSHLGRIGA